MESAVGIAIPVAVAWAWLREGRALAEGEGAEEARHDALPVVDTSASGTRSEAVADLPEHALR